MFNAGRLKVFLHEWNQPLANPRSEPSRVSIRRIFAPRLFLLFQVYAQSRSPDSQKGPHDDAARRMNTSDSGKASAAQNVSQNRFCLIIRRVSRCNAVQSRLLYERCEEFVSSLSRRVFQI